MNEDNNTKSADEARAILAQLEIANKKRFAKGLQALIAETGFMPVAVPVARIGNGGILTIGAQLEIHPVSRSQIPQVQVEAGREGFD